MITRTKKYFIISFISLFVILGLYLLISNFKFDFSFYDKSFDEDIMPLASQNETSVNKENSYTRYLSKYSEKEAKNAYQYFVAVENLVSDNTILDETKSYEYGNKTIKLENKQSVTFNLDVKQSGLYNIYVDYYFYDNSINDVEASFKINDEYPYYEAKQVLLKANWTPQTENFQIDRYGNQIIPSSNKEFIWYRHSDGFGELSDGSRLYNETFKGFFKKGINSFTLEIKSGTIIIGGITLTSTKEVYDYNTYSNYYKDNKIIKDLEIIEPEFITTKNDISVRISSDSNPKSTPYSTRYKKLNNVYMNSWNKNNQSLSWDFVVEESGLYNLSFKFLQTTLVDLPIYRNIYIDGELPFSEAKNYPFYYGKKWQNQNMTVDGEKAYIYLEKGTHTLTMKSSIDPYRSIIEELSKIMSEMSDISLQIKALTNGQTDEYRDWNITQYIPSLEQNIEGWIVRLSYVINYGNQFTDEKNGSSEFSNLKLAQNKLKKLLDDVDQIPNKMSEFTDGDASVSTYIGNVMLKFYDTPLGLEKIYLGDSKLPKANANIFIKAWEGIKKFFLSFFSSDYNSTSTSDDTLEVWVRRSRQYIEVMQMMADEAGIDVKFSIMPDQNKLVLANATGDLPDVAMGIDNWIPYDLALRGITVDLRDYEGYEEIVSKITPGAMIPYVYETGVYGIPESQDFWVQFYRTDILSNLGIEIPKTWDEVLGILPKLQRYGLNYYEPISLYTGLRPFVATLPFFYQWGGSLYSEDGMTTTLNEEQNIKALKFMTDLYTIYNIDKEVTSFYNYFRNGTLPIGIANAGTYLQLLVAAPEIKGNWDIAIHPGYENEDGSINHYATASSQGLTMFKSSDKKEEAWDFIEWWMSTPTQETFISKLYSMYGEAYLWFSANREAFMSLPITTEHKELIIEQLDYAIEVSRIPAAYVIEQTISDAFVQVVFSGTNVRIALDNAVIVSNREIERKMEEFGYMKDGKKVKDYLVPTIYNIKDWLTERK